MKIVIAISVVLAVVGVSLSAALAPASAASTSDHRTDVRACEIILHAGEKYNGGGQGSKIHPGRRGEKFKARVQHAEVVDVNGSSQRLFRAIDKYFDHVSDRVDGGKHVSNRTLNRDWGRIGNICGPWGVNGPVALTASSSQAPVVYSGYSGWSTSGHLPHKLIVPSYRLPGTPKPPSSAFRVKHWTLNNRGGAHNNWLALADHARFRSDGRTYRGYLTANDVRHHGGTAYYKHLDFYQKGANGGHWRLAAR